MIRIIHVISGLDTGGAEVMLVKVLQGLDRARFTNIVISLTDRGQLGEQIEASGIALHTLGMKRGCPNLSALVRLRRLFTTLQPAIVQSWLYHADLLSTLAVKVSGSPILVWNLRCSHMDLTGYSRLTRVVQRMLVWLSHVPVAVIANSVAGRQQHARLGYRPRRWVVIPNGFDLQRFRPDRSARAAIRTEWGLSDDTVLVAFIARVDPMKDHATFLDAAKRVVDSKRKAHFVLVGKDTETLAPSVAKRGLTDHVLLLGHHGHIEQLLPGVDVGCLSSLGEGFPNVLGEAMACGIPCISTDVGDARDIIGDTGLVVPLRDPASLAGAMTDLIDRGPAGRAKLGYAARVRIEAEYALPKVAEWYEVLYTELAAQSRSSRERMG